MAVCDLYGLFATFKACLRRLGLFATFMAVCDVYGCLRRVWLFALYMAVCDVYGLFAALRAVCDV